MDTVKFLEWLSSEKSMSARSAKAVVSRCSRVHRLLGIEELGVDAIDLLKKNDEFQNSSTFIRSQLKRAVSLYVEFQETQKKD